MPIEKAEGLHIILDSVLNDKKHVDYKRVVRLSTKLYIPLITGEDNDHLLIQFNLRETDKEFAQRKRLTSLVTPAICAGLMQPANKITNLIPLINDISYEDTKLEKDDGSKTTMDNAAKKNKMELLMSKWFGKDQSVDSFLKRNFIPPAYRDPNAFMLALYQNTNGKVRTFGSRISCEDAWNYEYVDDVLQFLTVHKTFQYEAIDEADNKKRKLVDGHYFIIYLDNHQIEFTQIDPAIYNIKGLKEKILYNGKLEPVSLLEKMDGTWPSSENYYVDGQPYFFKKKDGEFYLVKFYNQKSGRVQAQRIGYKYDPYTDGRTCVNGFHEALPYLMKSVKACSELDLSASLHAFLQKVSYVPPCPGEDGNGCKSGNTIAGDKQCDICKGSGLMPVHHSGQDHIQIRMPDNKEEFFELSNIATYVKLPVEVIEWQDKYLDKIEKKCYIAVYNTETLQKTVFDPTATGLVIDQRSITETLQPLQEQYESVRVFLTYMTAVFNSLDKGLTVVFKLPKNWKTESIAEIMTSLKSARDAGADESIISQLNDDIMIQLYADNPDVLKKTRIRRSLNPFNGKTADQIQQLLSSEFTLRSNKILWAELNNILDELENEQAAKESNLYTMPLEKIRPLVQSKLDAIIKKIDEDAPKLPVIPVAEPVI